MRGGLINPLFVSPPSAALRAAYDDLVQGTLTAAVSQTLFETGVAFALASVAGVGIGYLLWRFAALARAYEPLVAGLFAAPIILLYPIFLVIFGRTSRAIIAQAVCLAIMPVILFAIRAFSGVSTTLLKLSAVLQLSAWQRFRHILLPAAAPTVFTGLRLGVTYTLISVIAMEYLVQVGGIGAYINEQYLRFDMPQVYAGVLVVLVLTALFIAVTDRVERMVQR